MKEGSKEGRKEGRTDGRKEGRKEGRADGRADGIYNVDLSLYTATEYRPSLEATGYYNTSVELSLYSDSV